MQTVSVSIRIKIFVRITIMCTYLLHAPLPVSVMGFTGYVTKLGTLEENEETIEEQEEEILL